MDDEKLVVERDERLAAARVALARRTAEELPVDARRIVVFGQDHMQTAALGDTVAERDVGAASGHVRRHGDHAGLSGAGDDRRLVAVLLGVEDDVRNAGGREACRQFLRGEHRARADEHRAAAARRRCRRTLSSTAFHLPSASAKQRAPSSRQRDGRCSGTRDAGSR